MLDEGEVELSEMVDDGTSDAERDEALAPMLREVGGQCDSTLLRTSLGARGHEARAQEQDRLAPTHQSELSPSMISTGALYPTVPLASCTRERDSSVGERARWEGEGGEREEASGTRLDGERDALACVVGTCVRTTSTPAEAHDTALDEAEKRATHPRQGRRAS